MDGRRFVGVVILLLGTGASAGTERALTYWPPFSEEERAAPHVQARSHPVPQDFVDGQWQGIIAASDGRTYFSFSSHSPTNNAQFYRYDPEADRVTHIIDVGQWCGDDEYLGRYNTQGKIHSEMFEGNGKLYCSSCTAHRPPDIEYPGGHFLAYDLATGECLDLGTWPDGLLTLLYEPVYGRLYALSGNVLLYLDLDTREIVRVGQVADAGPQTRRLIGDRAGRVYGSRSGGVIYEYDPRRDRLRELRTRVPCDPAAPRPEAQPESRGWQWSWWRQVRWDPATKWWYGVHGNDEYLFRFRTPTWWRREGVAEGLAPAGILPSDRQPRLSSLGLALLGGRLFYCPYIYARAKCHLVSYEIGTGRVTDHGPIVMERGRRAVEIHSLTAGRDGNLHAAAFVSSLEGRDPAKPWACRGDRYFHSRFVVIDPREDCHTPPPRAEAPARLPTVTAQEPVKDPPHWALLERELIALINEAAPLVLAKYTRPDGTILWPTREDFQSVDALDDAYESFHNWPLFYAAGGADWFLAQSHREFNAITRQFARYGTGHGYPMVVKEYQPGYDWFHQGEGNYLFYMLCLADPRHPRSVARARRFAGFFMNEDPEAPNYDPEHRVIRCAHNGSRGPAFWNFTGDSIWTAEGYGLPFYDVPDCRTIADLKDPQIMRRMAAVAHARRGRGDAVQNLAATTLALNAFLLTGERKYLDWLTEYVDAWRARVAQNGGIVPDNVGLSGEIGEHIEGRWYGANYGWTWPHGWGSLGHAVTVAAQNALLATRDVSYVDLPRGQIDRLTAQGIEQNGMLHVPHKHGTPGKVCYTPWPWMQVLRNEDKTALEKDGWFEFMPMHPLFIAHVWNLSMDRADLERARKLRNLERHRWDAISGWSQKDQGGNDGAWMAYLQGEFPEYPEQILKHNIAQVYGRMAFLHADTEDPTRYGDSYFQQRNPVSCEGLVQLTMGGPLPVYYGGLLLARVRHFDPVRRRPGLPPDVAALVRGLTADRTVLQLVNLSLDEAREVIVQAGALGEHRFSSVKHRVREDKRWQTAETAVHGKWLRVELPPLTQITLELGTERFVNAPGYELPW